MNENIDVELLKRFITKMGMYIHPISKNTVVAFMSGYECSKGNNYLTNELSQFLANKYKIKKLALGYPYQIEEYSKKNKITWVEGFIQLMEELINIKISKKG